MRHKQVPVCHAASMTKLGWWLLGLGALALAAPVTLLSVAIWSIRCPGAAAASPQADVCSAVGDAGGTALMVLGLLAGAIAAVALLRRAAPAGSSPPVWAVWVAVALPAVSSVLVHLALELPTDHCTVEQQRAEAKAVADWRAAGGGDNRPDFCTAYDGS